MEWHQAVEIGGFLERAKIKYEVIFPDVSCSGHTEFGQVNEWSIRAEFDGKEHLFDDYSGFVILRSMFQGTKEGQ